MSFHLATVFSYKLTDYYKHHYHVHKKINIAIDGFSSCGKSTLAKALAKELHYKYIDSGAMYRAITLYFIKQHVDLTNETKILEALSAINIDLQTTPKEQRTIVFLNNEDVSAQIRGLEVANLVSEVASIKAVRQYAVKIQQAMGANGGVVMDGRDIGTVVFPDAKLKIFMTASEEIRVHRRYLELKAKQPDVTLEAVRANIKHRDLIDTTRAVDPLVKAKDAIELDNSHMTEAGQLQWVLDKYHALLHNA